MSDTNNNGEPKTPKVPKGPLDAPGPINPAAVLTEAELEAIEKQARNEIEAEAKKKAKALALEAAKMRLRQQSGLNEESEQVFVDVAPYADRITIDGVVYLQTGTYTVRRGVAATMYEIMAKTWNHQAEIDGKSENFYRRSRGGMVTPQGVVSNILRA